MNRAFPQPPIDGIIFVLGPGFTAGVAASIRNRSCEYSKEEFALSKIRLSVRHDIIHRRWMCSLLLDCGWVSLSCIGLKDASSELFELVFILLVTSPVLLCLFFSTSRINQMAFRSARTAVKEHQVRFQTLDQLFIGNKAIDCRVFSRI